MLVVILRSRRVQQQREKGVPRSLRLRGTPQNEKRPQLSIRAALVLTFPFSTGRATLPRLSTIRGAGLARLLLVAGGPAAGRYITIAAVGGTAATTRRTLLPARATLVTLTT